MMAGENLQAVFTPVIRVVLWVIMIVAALTVAWWWFG